MSIKNPLTLVGVEPAISRFVAQHLHHCANAVPVFLSVPTNKNPRESDHHNVWQHLENCLRAYTRTDMNIFPCIGKGSSLLKFVQAFHVRSVPGVILHLKTFSFGTAC